MSVKEKTDVLIDQNRNTLAANWMHTSSTSDADYMTQCDRVPRDMQHIAARETKRINFKIPCVNSVPTSPGISGGQMFTKLKQHPSDNSGHEHVSPKKLVSNITDRQDDDVVVESSSEDREDSVSKDTVQKRVCLVKLYAWVKEEMSRTAARSIASNLYQSEHKLLSRSDHESILHCSLRRDAVEQLLKKVLMGPCDIYNVFINACNEQEERHIAQRLVDETATDAELQVFAMLEMSSLQQCMRPDSDEPRLAFTESDHQTLLYYLNNKNAIDNINDHLLSRLIFSIREHTNVVNCSLDCEKRVRQLIEIMKQCAENIFKDFCEILKCIEMSHVVGKLEKRSQVAVRQRQKRKSSPEREIDSEQPSSSSSSSSSVPSAKRQCLNSSIECRLVSSMQKSTSTIRFHAIDQLGFDVENVNKGSIVIQLCPKEADSWNKLEENCRSGKIKDFIPVVYNNEAVQDLLHEGEYRLKFTIYTLPTRPETEEDKKVMFHLETEQLPVPKEKQEPKTASDDHPDNPIEEHSDLLCEELEINKDLLSVLKSEKLVEENIKLEIDKQGSRAKKIKYLLKEIGLHGGEKGYKVLKEYIKEENEDLYKALVTREEVKVIDNKMDTAAKVTKNRPFSGGHRGVYKKEVFFTGTVVLMVKKNALSKKKGKPYTGAEIEISCPEIIDPVCHFAEKGKENQSKSGEVTMVLEEAWSLVGANQPPQREILVGKRKQSKSAVSDSKRIHSMREDDDSEAEGVPGREPLQTQRIPGREPLQTDLKKEVSSKSEKLPEKNDTKQTDADTEDSDEKADETDSKNS